MRLELGNRVDCTDETFDKLVDVVIDPTSLRVTHLVVEPDQDTWLARLVPVELVERGDDASGDVIVLRATSEEVRQLSPVHEVAYLRLERFPVDDPSWDVGIEEVLALPHYSAYDLEPAPVDYAVTYDRIPKGGDCRQDSTERPRRRRGQSEPSPEHGPQRTSASATVRRSGEADVRALRPAARRDQMGA